MIVEISQPWFRNMNKVVVDRYKRQGIIPNLGQHKSTFEQTHGVRVIVKNSRWQALEFASEQAYLMAILKWQ
jgi:hypothetical protein